MIRSAYLTGFVRTPIGRLGGGLSGVRPDDLAALVVAAAVERQPGLDPADVDEVVLGDANGAGEDNRNVARMASLLAGLPPSVPGVTVNRLCASGLEAVIKAARCVVAGDADVVVAGGVESMTRAPWVAVKPDRAFPVGSVEMASTTLGWRLVNPSMPAPWTVSLGAATNALAAEMGIERDRQDDHALASHAQAASAWASGWYDDEVLPVPGTDLAVDESIRPSSTSADLARLPPAFSQDGTVTAGNSSPLSDGAAAVVVMSDEAVTRTGATPLARVAASAARGVEPHQFGLGPVEVLPVALRRAGIRPADLATIELNEAFAAQVLACLDALPALDPAIVNPRGGAIALGHPLGCSGTRLAGATARQLAAGGGRWGVATMCVGVGQGVALVLEVA